MKPHVICHMLAPLDGRLLVDPWAPEDSALQRAMLGEYQRLHDEFAPDAWLAGTTTLEEFATGEARRAAPDPVPERPFHLADTAATRFAIALDRHGRLHWAGPTADDGHVVVVLGASVPDSHLAELRDAGVSWLVMPGDELDLARLLDELGTRLKLKRVLLEGGARINGAFLRAGLVDEISLLLCPAIDGRSGGPAIFENGDASLGPALRLELRSAQPVAAGAVHLRYDVALRAPRPHG